MALSTKRYEILITIVGRDIARILTQLKRL